MAARIVVGFLTRVDSASTEAGDVHVRRVTELRKKAEALGGRLCAFGSRSVAFEFLEDEMEEAIFLALGEVAMGEGEDLGEKESSSRTPWRMGIAEGEMFPLADAGPLATLSWGA